MRMSTIVDKRLIYCMACIAAILIFFQAHFVCGKVNVNINIADIFAICGFVIVILSKSTFENTRFRIPHVKTFFLCAFTAFSMAFLWGLYRFGFTGFAFFSKFMGFFVLVGYFSVGFLFIEQTGAEKGFKILLGLMTTVLVCIIIFQIMRHILEVVGLMKYNYYHSSLSGYAGNRNAFAMQILCVAAMRLATLSSSKKLLYYRNCWLLAILFSGIFFTYSRSAIITSIFLFSLYRGLCFMTTKELRDIGIKIFLVVAGVFLLENILCFLINSWEAALDIQLGARSMFTMQQYSPTTSDPQRLYSIVEGLRLWVRNPFLGIGLGGFFHHEIIKNGLPLVIHNTFIWILTEFGIIGSSIFFLYGFTILKYLYNLILSRKASLWSIQDKLIFNLVIIFLLMGSAHEIFYQRIFWFILGAAIVAYRSIERSGARVALTNQLNTAQGG